MSHKFKVGDRVRRTTVGDKGTVFIDSGGKVGEIYTVAAITFGQYLKLKEMPDLAGAGWWPQFFELVNDKVEEDV